MATSADPGSSCLPVRKAIRGDWTKAYAKYVGKLTKFTAYQHAGSSSGSSSSGIDPRYSTCAEAEAHGYGPYVNGKDPEYGWYRDADHDGTVCE
jgi:hypothetical protein